MARALPTAHHHDRRNGAAINYLTIQFDVDAGYNITAIDSVVLHDRRNECDLGGDDRRAALERANAAIASDLTGDPSAGVVPGNGELPDSGELATGYDRQFLRDIARYFREHGDGAIRQNARLYLDVAGHRR